MKKSNAGVGVGIALGALAVSAAAFAGWKHKQNKANLLEGPEEIETSCEVMDGEGNVAYTAHSSQITDESRNLIIEYPQIEGFEDELLMNTINSVIRESVIPWTANPYINTKLSYKITKATTEILSVRFEGVTDIQAMSEDEKINTSVNIDMITGKRIDYNDLIHDVEAHSELINQKAEEEEKILFQGEGLKFYMVNDGTMYYYMPLDDSSSEFVEIFVSDDEQSLMMNYYS